MQKDTKPSQICSGGQIFRRTHHAKPDQKPMRLMPLFLEEYKLDLIRVAARKWCSTARDQGDMFCPTERCEQPRVARPAGVAPGDARSIEQLRVAVSGQEQPRAARLYRATASDKSGSCRSAARPVLCASVFVAFSKRV